MSEIFGTPEETAKMVDEHIARLRHQIVMRWLPAANVPEEWEGKTAFRRDGYEGRPIWTIVPRGFSRDPRHCGGIFFCKVELPPLEFP